MSINCKRCKHTLAHKTFIPPAKLVKAFIPSNAIFDIRLKRHGFIGRYVVLANAGSRTATTVEERCLPPGSNVPVECEDQRAERERAERRVKEKEVKERAENEAKEKAAREAREKAEREKTEREKAEKEQAEKAEREAREKAERESHPITSVDGTRGDLAPYSGEFTVAYQPFTARADTVTYLGVTVGNPNVSPGLVSDTVTIRLCGTATCEGSVLATANVEVNNYGLSVADIGEVPVTVGQTYYIVWAPPSNMHGSHWVTFWHAGAPAIVGSKELEAIVRGYKKGDSGSHRAIIDYGGRQPPPAPYSGPFVYAFLNFKAATDTMTRLGVVVGNPNPKLVRGEEVVETIVLRLCETSDCSKGVLATSTPNIVNYGVTEAYIGDVKVTSGATYYVNWLAPKKFEGTSWVTFWFGPGPLLEESNLTEAFAKGYNRGTKAPLVTYYPEQTGNLGGPTFSDPYNATGEGVPIGANVFVEVTCKLFAPEVPSIEPDGYWYKIHSVPWNDVFYTSANTFWNGGALGGETINTDAHVRNC